MDAVVGHPCRKDVEPREAPELFVRPRSRQRLRRDGGKQVEAALAAGAKRLQHIGQARLSVAPLFGPALRLDRRELARAVHDDAQTGAEVFGLLIAQVAEDLDRRPLVRRRSRTCALAGCGSDSPR